MSKLFVEKRKEKYPRQLEGSNIYSEWSGFIFKSRRYFLRKGKGRYEHLRSGGAENM